MVAELVEVERNTWSGVLLPDGTLRRVSDVIRVITRKDKTRLTGYKSDRIICLAAESPRVQELLQLLEKGISKEDLE